MLSPMPHRVVEASPSMPTSPLPACTIDLDSVELNNPRPFWYETPAQSKVDDEDEATQDLRDVLCPKSWTKMLPEWSPAFDTRCLSAASTTAMSPGPPLSQFSPPSSPDRDLVEPATPATDIESPSNERLQCPPGALDKSSWLQARKVFVGGIPQTVDQNGLYHMFSKVGKVKKAWIQLFHNDRGSAQGSTAKKHRGFGFVIFHERQSIDNLLGKEFSQFVCFGDDLKLEVKRSVGKVASTTKTGGEQEEPKTARSKTGDVAPPSTPSHRDSPSGSQILQATPSQAFHAVPVGYQMCQSPAAMTPQTWHGSMTPAMTPQAFVVGFVTPQTWHGAMTPQPVNMPFVPAFPFVGVTQQSNSPVLPFPGAATSNVSPSTSDQPCSQFLPNVLIPQSSEEMRAVEKALIEALPERYED